MRDIRKWINAVLVKESHIVLGHQLLLFYQRKMIHSYVIKELNKTMIVYTYCILMLFLLVSAIVVVVVVVVTLLYFVSFATILCYMMLCCVLQQLTIN